jgi:hypothetical protein
MGETAQSQTKQNGGYITQIPTGILQRNCDCGNHTIAGGVCGLCGKQNESANIQRAAIKRDLSNHVPPIVHEVLRSPGQPLGASTRAFFEPRFGLKTSLAQVSRAQPSLKQLSLSVGRADDRYEREADTVAKEVTSISEPGPGTKYDFSDIRIHSDARAAESARAVNAQAYTVGRDIVFGANRYAPQTYAGRRLLAHELTHVAQQRATGERIIARQAVEQYETKGFILDRPNIEMVEKLGYWFRLILDAYEMPTVPQRILDDPEERDAVLSVLWSRRPKGPLTVMETQQVSIPSRSGAKDSKPLLYQFIFSPRDATKPDAKDHIDIKFIAAGDPGGPVVLKQAPTVYTPSIRFGEYVNFPGDDLVKYFKQHPEEERALLWWVETQAPETFNQIIDARIPTKPGVAALDTWFKLEGTKNKKQQVTGLRITYLTAIFPTSETAPSDYRSKDAGDAMVEKAQSKPHEKKNDKLGTVTIPASVPAEEQVAVKYAVAQYFDTIGTRNAEVDAIVPIPGKTTSVFYTFRFRPNNDVDVERIGEQGKDPKAGQIDEKKLDVARAPEYADKSKDVATLTSWLKTRYKNVTITGKTVDELRDNINKEAEAKAEKPDWFENYDLKILDAKQGETRLTSVHKYAKERVKDIKEFLPKELGLLELMLEKLTRKILDLIKYVRLARQRVAIDFDKTSKAFKEKTDIGGRTETIGASKTIVIFDGAMGGKETQFLGGQEGVLPEDVFIYGHEFGHVVGNAGAQQKFNSFVKKKNIKPFTRYAQQTDPGPGKEFFPEALALFETDPEWIRSNYPELHAWFVTLTKTGVAP